jgi:hypothetical protein
MPQTAVAHDLPSLVFAREQLESRARERITPSPPLSGRVLGWVAEFLRLVAVVYMLPIAILAIGIPIALATNALILAAGWAWRAL